MSEPPTIVVYCDAASHEPWVRVYTRDYRGWMPEMFDNFDPDDGSDRLGRPFKAKRDGGVTWHDADGDPVPLWDQGRNLHEAAERIVPALAATPTGRRLVIRCPFCGDGVRRTGDRFDGQMDALAAQGVTRISLSGLRALDRFNTSA